MVRKRKFGKKKKSGAGYPPFKKTAVVYGEMIKGGGEDFFVISECGKYGLMGVFDGCGGSGARVYTEYENRTGAYISSRSAANAVLHWFERFCGGNTVLSKNTVDDICADIEEAIYFKLKQIQEGVSAPSLKGSMLKDFPTTASLICYTEKQGSLYSAFLWCGDSRGYILQKHGLTQITADDINEGLDAFANLRSDGQLTNVISADGNFVIHGITAEFGEPTVLITATDGSFGYFSSPMAFEYMLLKTLAGALCTEGWCAAIDDYLRQLSGDDYTICIYIYGFGDDFAAVKDYFFDRRQRLSSFLLKWDEADEAERQKLWDEYKSVYYGEVI